VFVSTAYGAVAAFALDGKPLWTFWTFAPADKRRPLLEPATNNTFYGNSPVVAGPVVSCRHSGWVLGLERASGKPLWIHQQTDPPSPKLRQVVDHVGTASVLRFGDTPVILQPRGLAQRASDGKVLADPVLPAMRGMAQNMYAVDPATNTVYFGVGGHSGFEQWGEHKFSKGTYAVRLHLDGDVLRGELLWKKDATLGDATAVFWRGKIYSGGFALDAATGEQAGRHDIDTAQGWVIAGGRLWGGLCHEVPHLQSAPIGADGLVGATATSLIGKLDGFSDEEKARMRTYGSEGIGKWYGWAIGRGYPIFSGNRIFVRTFDHLYAIGEPGSPFTPSASATPAP
jgi:outer membrane protein assembly factor BamB